LSEQLSSKHIGDRLESEVIQLVPGLEWVSDRDDEHIDAVTTEAVWPSDRVRLGGICVVEPDTRVEIKSATVRLTSGQRGRYYIRKQQHEALLEDSGVYFLAIYAPASHEVITLAGVPATIVDERLPGWRDLDRGETYTQVSWSSVVNPAIVPREGGGRGV